MKLNTLLRNARAQQVINLIGPSPSVKCYSGAMPASTSDTATGTLIAQLDLPSTWASTPSAGSFVQVGTWSTTSIAGGAVGYVRFCSADGTCWIQSDLVEGLFGSNGNTVDGGETVEISGFVWTESGA